MLQKNYLQDDDRKRKRESRHSVSMSTEVYDLSEIKCDKEARIVDLSKKLLTPARSLGKGSPSSILSSGETADIKTDMDLEHTSNHDRSLTRLANASPNSHSLKFKSEIEGQQDESIDTLPISTGVVNYVYVGTFRTKVVGIRFYSGSVNLHEHTLLVRDTTNIYDVNAIQVFNVNNQQVGHLPADIAAGMAPWLDNDICKSEASIHGKRGVYSIPLMIDIFANIEVASHIPMAFARVGIELLRSKANLSTSALLAKYGGLPLASPMSTVVNTRQGTALIDQLMVNEQDLAGMVMASQPRRVRTRMLDYQLQGLRWMIEKENPKLPEHGGIYQLWKEKNGCYINLASLHTAAERPVLGRGGLLADDMGLGKTIQVLSLLVAEASSAFDEFNNYATGPTLILCPRGLISNWRDQALQHILQDDPLDVEIYHGKSKASTSFLSSKELVISTYGTLVADFKAMIADNPKDTPGLFAVKWKRVVLDESHKIRNPRAQICIAANALKSHARWCLTGTPIVNSYNDLGVIVRFVGWTGGPELNQVFNSKITRNLHSSGELVRSEAITLVQIMMRDLSLRRRKNMTFNGKELIQLPGITEYCHKIDFETSDEVEIYEKLSRQAKVLWKSGTDRSASQILEILLRMRQAACSLDLISSCRLAQLEELEMLESVEFTKDNKILLQHLLSLNIESSGECPICMDSLRDHLKTPVITHCKHVFCKECIVAAIATNEVCPLCRSSLHLSQILERETLVDQELPQRPARVSGGSSKISALLKLLISSKLNDASTKTVVFSQWTKLLDLIEPHLRAAQLPFSRIDGTMTNLARDTAIQTFGQEADCCVMLASLGVASVGLNLVMANQVILCDPWWAPAIEDQSVDRVYRLGQKRPVTVYKLVVENTVEERVLEIQERKRKMTATVGGQGETREQAVQSRRADFGALLSD